MTNNSKLIFIIENKFKNKFFLENKWNKVIKNTSNLKVQHKDNEKAVIVSNDKKVVSVEKKTCALFKKLSFLNNLVLKIKKIKLIKIKKIDMSNFNKILKKVAAFLLKVFGKTKNIFIKFIGLMKVGIPKTIKIIKKVGIKTFRSLRIFAKNSKIIGKKIILKTKNIIVIVFRKFKVFTISLFKNIRKLLVKFAKSFSKCCKYILSKVIFIISNCWLLLRKVLRNFGLLVTLIFKYPFRAIKYVFTKISCLFVTFVKKINLKPVLIVAIVICFFGGASCIFASQYRRSDSLDNKKVVKSERATNEKLFSIGDIITYRGVDYQVTKVETSLGNSYKSPREGNIFVIVYVTITNNTGDKIQYSYNNWTMSNSVSDDDKWIFTSVNAGTALYTGELIIGGVKSGSIVFEQPKDDDKLRLNFYDLMYEENSQLVEEKEKAFSVSIHLPTEESKQEPEVVNTMSEAN